MSAAFAMASSNLREENHFNELWQYELLLITVSVLQI